MKQTIAIIGSGNMGQAIAQGLLSKKIITKQQLFLTNSKTKNNKEVAQKADSIILAVKPYILEEILLEIKDVVREEQLLISIAAGITIKRIQDLLIYSSSEAEGRIEKSEEDSSRLAKTRSNNRRSIVRVMPNLAAQVGQSMSVWFANTQVTKMKKKLVTEILSAIGVELEVLKEEEIDKATAISGSGPAYFYYLVEQLENAALQFGFSQEVARNLAKQTFIGAAETIKYSEKSAEELRLAVTSKGGTTEAAVTVFQKEKLHSKIQKGIVAAFTRAKQLGA